MGGAGTWPQKQSQLSPTRLTSSLLPDDYFYRYQTASSSLAAMFYRASR